MQLGILNDFGLPSMLPPLSGRSVNVLVSQSSYEEYTPVQTHGKLYRKRILSAEPRSLYYAPLPIMPRPLIALKEKKKKKNRNTKKKAIRAQGAVPQKTLISVTIPNVLVVEDQVFIPQTEHIPPSHEEVTVSEELVVQMTEQVVKNENKFVTKKRTKKVTRKKKKEEVVVTTPEPVELSPLQRIIQELQIKADESEDKRRKNKRKHPLAASLH
jgi:hypothetical protein